MAPNSHVVKWLISSYRRVLRKLRIREAEQGSMACLDRTEAPRMGNLEPLEDRMMLSTTQITDLTKAAYTGSPTLQSNMQTVMAAGINSVADELGSISGTQDFKTDVPGVLKYATFGQAPTAANLFDMLNAVKGAGLTNLIKNGVASPIGALATGSPITAMNLAPLAGSLFGIDFAVTVNNAQLTPISGNDYKLSVDVNVTLVDADSDALFFDLGRNADQFGIRTTVPNIYFPSFADEVNVKAGLSVTFQAAEHVTITEVTPGAGNPTPDVVVTVADDNSGFFMTGGSITATADIDTNAQGIHPISAAQQLGFLDVNLQLQSFTLDGNIKLDLEGPGNSSTVNFADLDSMTTSDPQISGSIDADVDITVDDNAGFGANFNVGPHNYEVRFVAAPTPGAAPVLGTAVSSIAGSGDKRAAPTVVLSTDAATRLEPYKNVTPGGVVAMLKSFAEKLGTIPASSVMNANLPLATGTTLGDLIPLGDIVSNHLVFDQTANPKSAGTKLVDSNGNPVFTSAQTFINSLAGVLGVAAGDIDAVINPTHNTGGGKNEIVFTIGVDLATAPSALTASQAPINLDLDELEPFAGLKANAQVTLTPTGTVGFTFGVDVAAAGTTDIVIAPPVQNTRIIGVVNGAGAVQTPANGRLSGDAVFRLSVGGSPNGNKSFSGGVATVKLLASATSTNNNVNDLVQDLQAAIDSALNALDPTHLLPNPVAEPLTGRKLVKVGALADGRITLSPNFSSFLKVEVFTGDAGGFAQLGLVNNQLANIAPTPWTGKLSGNAEFDLKLGTGAPVHVSITQAETLGNSNFNDLLTIINNKVKAATSDKVHAEFLGGITGAIILRVDSGDRSLQILNPTAAVVNDIGWTDRQIHAEIQAVGRADLAARGGTVPGGDASTGNPGGNFSFDISIDGLPAVTVTVRQTADLDDPNDPND
jgi:hypothetical protein